MEFMNHPLHDAIAELFNDKVEGLESFGLEPTAEPIRHTSCPGFIPYTNGGWSLRIMETLDGMNGSGTRYNPEVQDELERAINYSLDSALEEFISENLDELEDLYETRDEDELEKVVNYHDLHEKEAGELAEKLSEAEHEHLSQGGDFYLVLRASYFAADNNRNQSGEDEIYFHAGINTDYGYGREKYLQITHDQNVKVSELTESGLRAIVDEMVESLKEESFT